MPRRIALLIHSLHGGGAERLMSQLATRWSSEHEVHLVTWASSESDQYPLPDQVVRHGLQLQFPSSGMLSGLRANWKRVQKLRQKLKAICPDFILSFSDQMNIVALEAARPISAPIWIAEHSDPAKQRLSRLWEAWRSRSYPTCNGCVALTPSIAHYMERWVPAARMHVIPPAINPQAVDTQALDRPAVDTQAMDITNRKLASRATDRRKSFLFLGRLSREKGLDLLIQTWHKIADALPDWDLIIVGEGEQRIALETLAGGSESIRFCGWTTDPWTHYRTADCFVLPSRYEGFPVALLEAMSQGTPAIATRCSSAIEQLADSGRSLRVVPTESIDELATAMRTLARDHALRQSLADAAKQVAATYSWNAIGPMWDALLSPASTLKPTL